MEYYKLVLKKYAVFSGRASRKEYWMFFLFNCIFTLIFAIIDSVIGLRGQYNIGILGSIYALILFIPALAVTVRRFHDTNRSGWWLLLLAFPILGFIAVLVFLLLDSNPGTNDYGPNPKEIAPPAPEIPTPTIPSV